MLLGKTFRMVYVMVWYGNNLFDITEIHNTLLYTVLN